MPDSLATNDKRVHAAIPIRVSYWDGTVRTCQETACTYDIHARGARVFGLRNVKSTGEIITVERGRNKALFRVSWVGDPQSALRGQCGIECVEDEKLPWLAELQEMEEVYNLFPEPNFAFSSKLSPAGANRRKATRFPAASRADLFKVRGTSPLSVGLKDVSENGCKLTVAKTMIPGTDVHLRVPVLDCELSLSGQIRYASADAGTGVEFRQIRHGDRPLFDLLLRTLAEHRQDTQRWNFEVVEATQ